uniref:NADH-ubiquinone oxidoreductase chain 2 n=1 Tax=Fejervarya cancrivora TaxID=111367 RepID=C3RXV2_FEJCA|nr:NADH dehydrogenase subunit 2 [Fejervarya cancrivora]ACD49884.1 NADH dehydrogenase subunit 2 [Fejervarya cancrivora]
MNPITLTVLISSLALGTTITLSSNHWLLAWIGLEINTLAVIPFLTLTPHPRAIEAATKYFLTQASASALILFSASMSAWKTGEWAITSLSAPFTITLPLALMMKLGLAPMHFWLPEVIQGVPLMSGLILSTWQKVAPLSLLIQINHLIDLNILIALGLTSALVGGWGGINQTQLRKIMAFSSIGHLGWMIIILKFNPILTIFNFLLYSIMTAAMFLSLISISATKMTDITSAWPKSPLLTTITMFTLLSLAGLPPLTGFAPKLFITLELVKQESILLSAVLMLASLLALFFYIRLTYLIILTIPPNISLSTAYWRSSYSPVPTAIFNTLALLIFPMSTTLLLTL